MKPRQMPLWILIAGLVAISGCEVLPGGESATQDGQAIQASGVIEADQVDIASDTGGRIKEIHVAEGERVEKASLVLSLENDLLLAQKNQAEAQVAAAKAQFDSVRAGKAAAAAAMRSAELNLEAAEILLDQVTADIRAGAQPDRTADWNQNPPSRVEIPAWYFLQSEQVEAARKEVQRAEESYQNQLRIYQETLADSGGEELQDAESQLASAWAAYEIAQELDSLQVGFDGREQIEDYLEVLIEGAESDLESAQKAYNQLLTDPRYEEVLEARARVVVAEERLELAQEYLTSLLVGKFSLEIQAAEIQLAQAEAGLEAARSQVLQADIQLQAAQTAVDQAEASLALIELQIDQSQIYSPITGTVLSRSAEPGEVLAPGYTALTIGNLEKLTLTVYIPEDRYGQISLGDSAQVRIDSDPDAVFPAVVIQIADEAEYTPRNVQTQEERQNTVYAVKLSLTDPGEILKPGMPADVTFLP